MIPARHRLLALFILYDVDMNIDYTFKEHTKLLPVGGYTLDYANYTWYQGTAAPGSSYQKFVPGMYTYKYLRVSDVRKSHESTDHVES